MLEGIIADAMVKKLHPGPNVFIWKYNLALMSEFSAPPPTVQHFPSLPWDKCQHSWNACGAARSLGTGAGVDDPVLHANL